MFNDSVSFNGGTRVEVIAVLANCGRDTDRARRALVTWIRRKQDKQRSTEHILAKLRDIESKFINDTSLHSAFRDARAETFLPRPPDLPLPAHIKRRSGGHIVPESAPPASAPIRARPNSLTSSIIELSTDLTRNSQSSSSRGSRTSEPNWKSKSVPARPASQPHPIPRIPEFPSPPIQIPRSLRPGPSSPPTTSSPEDSGNYFRYHHLSQPVDLPLSPESPIPYSNKYWNPRGLVHNGPGHPQPSQLQIPHSRRRPSVPQSPGTSSSEESEFRSRYYQMAWPAGRVSPGRSQVTPPRTNPPDLPLPPIPSDDQGVESDDGESKKSLPREQPPTPVRSIMIHTSTPVRPLPIQPIPSPVPGAEEWEHENSLRQCWNTSNGELPLMREVARQDSPVYAFHADSPSHTSFHPPPPYVTELDTHSPDMAPIGESLDRAVSMCGGSQEVRREVSRCIKFDRGYEPPYWQTRLQACGLNAEAAKYLVDQMSKQVDWATSFNRIT